jgi:hypothetical protein
MSDIVNGAKGVDRGRKLSCELAMVSIDEEWIVENMIR